MLLNYLSYDKVKLLLFDTSKIAGLEKILKYAISGFDSNNAVALYYTFILNFLKVVRRRVYLIFDFSIYSFLILNTFTVLFIISNKILQLDTVLF